ncbi:hypothetical protein [Vibrio mediterranei]|uniref:hypothetical protein n=1 Tax=Vibrio mediterranei TaxID=689 RepID=UPI004068F2DC
MRLNEETEFSEVLSEASNWNAECLGALINEARARRVAETLAKYVQEQGNGAEAESIGTVLRDFLGDLMHLADKVDVNVQEIVELAELTYQGEVRDALRCQEAMKD